MSTIVYLKDFRMWKMYQLKYLKRLSSMVIPVLLFGCEISGPFLLGKITSFKTFKTSIFKITNQIEKLHLKFCKRILGVHSKSTNLAVYGEIGRTPLIVQIATFIAKFGIKSPTLTNNLASDAARVCMQSNLQPVLFTKYLLQLCNIKIDNFQDFTIPSDQQENFFYSLIHEYFIKYWKEQIQQGGNNCKLRVYRNLLL